MIRLTSVDVNKALDQVVRGSLWLEGSVSGLGRFQKDAQDVARKIATLDQRCVARGVSEIDDWAEVGAVTGAFSVVRGSVATEIAGRLKDYTVESKAGPVVVVDFRMRDGLAEVRVRSTARWHEVTLPADAFYLFCRALDSGRIRAKVEANVKRVRAEAAAKKELLSI